MLRLCYLLSSFAVGFSESCIANSIVYTVHGFQLIYRSTVSMRLFIPARLICDAGEVKNRVKHVWYCMIHRLWIIMNDCRVFDLWASLSTVGMMCLIYGEGEFSSDEKSTFVWHYKNECLICVAQGEFSNVENSSSVWYHKNESQNSNISKWEILSYSS